jgi:hypothetical protein
MRGEAVTLFAEVESIIDQVIALHYARIFRTFVLEVTSDEYFSWALRRSLFAKVAQARSLYDEKGDQRLRQLGNLRNLFAHTQRVFGIVGPDFRSTGGVCFLDPKDPSNRLDPDVEFKRFKDLHAQAMAYVESIWAAVVPKPPEPGPNPDAPGTRP